MFDFSRITGNNYLHKTISLSITSDFLRNLKKKDLKYGRSMGSDVFAFNFSKKLDSTDCSMRVFERLDF